MVKQCQQPGDGPEGYQASTEPRVRPNQRLNSANGPGTAQEGYQADTEPQASPMHWSLQCR